MTRDRIVEMLQDSWGVHAQEKQTIKGIFDPSYGPPPPHYRLVAKLATATHGGEAP